MAAASAAGLFGGPPDRFAHMLIVRPTVKSPERGRPPDRRPGGRAEKLWAASDNNQHNELVASRLAG